MGRRTLIWCTLLLAVLSQGTDKDHYNPIRSELKYLRCEVCQATATALHQHTAAAAARTKKKLTEEAVGKVIEAVCQPEPGNWILHQDVIERNGYLKLRSHKEEGACRRECKTIASSCQDLLDSLDDVDELQVALWKGSSEKVIREKLCSEWSSACSQNAPKFSGKRLDENSSLKRPLWTSNWQS
eukprot:TRINITY_DN18584_c0_g1_i2.p1 TRINITY_DN18584_c0_g1~~TRINITY_DN18584_c0_g1_i2.p1  ORF type:complete len:185 (+),score=43.34 TRINITY_DN18584_c0_g1_i2:3-557(+)